jgi:hypothetical protein
MLINYLVKCDIFYKFHQLRNKFLHYDLELFSTLCPKADFGIMSFHQMKPVTKLIKLKLGKEIFW